MCCVGGIRSGLVPTFQGNLQTPKLVFLLGGVTGGESVTHSVKTTVLPSERSLCPFPL